QVERALEGVPLAVGPLGDGLEEAVVAGEERQDLAGVAVVDQPDGDGERLALHYPPFRAPSAFSACCSSPDPSACADTDSAAARGGADAFPSRSRSRLIFRSSASSTSKWIRP